MRIWRLASTDDGRFAEAGRRGTWSAGGSLCEECTASSEERVQPLVVAWEPGSDLVGDFTVTGLGSDVMVTAAAGELLGQATTGFELGPVEMVDDPSRKPRRGQPFVALPYEGPGVHDLWITTLVDVDRDRSTVQLQRRCTTCGTESWAVSGIERWETVWDRQQMKGTRTLCERVAGAGLWVRESELKGAGFFRVRQCPAWVLCTDPVRELIGQHNLTNVAFLETGDTF